MQAPGDYTAALNAINHLLTLPFHNWFEPPLPQAGENVQPYPEITYRLTLRFLISYCPVQKEMWSGAGVMAVFPKAVECNLA